MYILTIHTVSVVFDGRLDGSRRRIHVIGNDGRHKEVLDVPAMTGRLTIHDRFKLRDQRTTTLHKVGCLSFRFCIANFCCSKRPELLLSPESCGVDQQFQSRRDLFGYHSAD